MGIKIKHPQTFCIVQDLGEVVSSATWGELLRTKPFFHTMHIPHAGKLMNLAAAPWRMEAKRTKPKFIISQSTGTPNKNLGDRKISLHPMIQSQKKRILAKKQHKKTLGEAL